MNSDDQNKIEELNKSLYSRNAPDIKTKRRLRFQERDTDVKTDWEHPADESSLPEDVLLNTKYKDRSMSFFTKIFLVSIVFFLFAVGIGAYLTFYGGNTVSGNNVDITINGPLSVAGGEPVSFEVQITNQNNIKLETVDLSIDFPSGTVDADDSLKELKNIRELIPDIDPGGMGQRTVKAVLYGEENSKKEIKVSIEYRVRGSNAVFLKEKTFDLLISSSPLTQSITSFKEVNSGQEFEMTVNINSNSKEVIKNLILKTSYPFGFSFISSDVKPMSDNASWKIGDIPPGGKKTIKIKGKLEGQDDEVRVFRFITGIARLGNDNSIATEYINSTQEISIKKPFMTVDIATDGDSSSKEYIASFNNPIKIDISYFNNLSDAVSDAEIRVKLSGTSFDKTAVSADSGLYKSLDNEIVWNSVTTDDLRNVEPGGGGKVSFSITPRDLSNSQKLITNPDLKIVVSVSGKRISESNVPEKIAYTANKTVKVSSNISLGGQSLRSTGPFVNTGPIPPRAEQETTYTILWTVDNTANSISDAVVRTSLPANVKWLGKIDPLGEDISYDKSSGQIVWNVGGLNTYTAGTSKRRQVAFQLALTPNINQVGRDLTLVNQSTLTATDDFTAETLKSNLGVLSTKFSTDPQFKDGDDRVAQ